MGERRESVRFLVSPSNLHGLCLCLTSGNAGKGPPQSGSGNQRAYCYARTVKAALSAPYSVYRMKEQNNQYVRDLNLARGGLICQLAVGE
jgi:hypothetical protein